MREPSRNDERGFLALALLVALASSVFEPNSASAHELRAAFTSQCPTTNFPVVETRVGATGLPAAIAVAMAGQLVDTGIATLKKVVNPDNSVLDGEFLGQGLYMYALPDDKRPDYGTNSGKGPQDPQATKGQNEFIASEEPKAVVLPSTKMECLVIATGTFTSAKPNGRNWNLPFNSERAESDTSAAAQRVSDALGLNGSEVKLALYMEAVRVYSSDMTAVTWKPVRFYVGDYLNDSFWAGKSRGVLVQVRLYKPGQKEAFLAQDFAFPNVRKPVDRGSESLVNGNTGAWNKLPAAPAVPENIKPLPEGKEFDPYTLEVRIVETPKPYMLAQAFADAVEKNKDAIKQEVTEKIDPNAKAAAALTAERATLEAISKFVDALNAVTSNCADDKVKDAAGQLACSISRDNASLARQEANRSCISNRVASCDSLPSVPDAPKVVSTSASKREGS